MLIHVLALLIKQQTYFNKISNYYNPDHFHQLTLFFNNPPVVSSLEGLCLFVCLFLFCFVLNSVEQNLPEIIAHQISMEYIHKYIDYNSTFNRSNTSENLNSEQ